ncbi:MAG: DUF4194 domain-containing protein [Oligoflexia bacterium]|nr:DUF4194 domain-containing protein [Oligoflexia bacterium]MBF0367476.1 DUF4194 domain-containing protein [Oligoflexia bacterium]
MGELSKENKIDLSERLYQQLLIRLLQGSIQSEEHVLWNTLLVHRSKVEAYFKEIGLNLRLDEVDGYAFLSTRKVESEMDDYTDCSGEMVNNGEVDEEKMPTLVRRMPLSIDVSLLLLLLREEMGRFEKESIDDHRLIMSKNDLRQLLFPYYEEMSDQTRLQRKIDVVIGKIKDLGMIKELKGRPGHYEVRRMIKSMIDAGVVEGMLLAIKGQLSNENLMSKEQESEADEGEPYVAQ